MWGGKGPLFAFTGVAGVAGLISSYLTFYFFIF